MGLQEVLLRFERERLGGAVPRVDHTGYIAAARFVNSKPSSPSARFNAL